MRDHVVATRSRPPALRRAVILFAVTWAVIGVAAIGVGTASANQRSVTVMTQNLYQGTEFAHIRVLAQSKVPVSFNEALAATTADYATYVATRFKDRAKQIAAEIAQNEPALVGLQEVATWHKGAFDPAHPFALPPEVSEDFAKVLLEALEADGSALPGGLSDDPPGRQLHAGLPGRHGRTSLWAYRRRHGRTRRDPRPDRSSCQGS